MSKLQAAALRRLTGTADNIALMNYLQNRGGLVSDECPTWEDVAWSDADEAIEILQKENAAPREERRA